MPQQFTLSGLWRHHDDAEMGLGDEGRVSGKEGSSGLSQRQWLQASLGTYCEARKWLGQRSNLAILLCLELQFIQLIYMLLFPILQPGNPKALIHSLTRLTFFLINSQLSHHLFWGAFLEALV